MKMIWKVIKDNKQSYLVGTAHFFPYSFKTSLSRYIETARTVILEGPLDKVNMARVVEAGYIKDHAYNLFNDLDNHTVVSIIKVLFPVCRNKKMFLMPDFRTGRMENLLYGLVKGMAPWLAFFTIWSSYLKKNGWTHSVDLEGYVLAREHNKKIVFLETIEEQINILESLSYKRILDFLKRVDNWHDFSKEYSKCYLNGNLSKLRSMRLGFPSRHYSVINYRDEIFYTKMAPHLKHGDALAFVGAPHVQGLSRRLIENGYQMEGPEIHI